jgi:hypothetical protein
VWEGCGSLNFTVLNSTLQKFSLYWSYHLDFSPKGEAVDQYNNQFQLIPILCHIMFVIELLPFIIHKFKFLGYLGILIFNYGTLIFIYLHIL